MSGFTLSFLVAIVGVLSFLCVLLVRRLNRLETAYKKSLELAQQSLDQQISRLNILIRSLPNLQTLLNNPQTGDNWKSFCLDETRALIWAEGARYWRYLEKEQVLILDVAKGLSYANSSDESRIQLGKGFVGEAAEKRIPVSTENGVAVPLVVFDRVWGVFEYIRQGDNLPSQREIDLIMMFLSHLALSMENQELSKGRETFYLELVQTLAEVVDMRDSSGEGQSRRARELARGIAKELEMPNEFTHYLEYAALLHDIGKIAVSDSILKKPDRLTPEEFEIVKKHPEHGYKILSSVRLLTPVAPMVLYHQEWYNGKGYPEGLSGEEIPLGARIVAVLDAWGAMVSDRPWRKALPVADAIEELKKGAGTQFDPAVVDAFIRTLRKQGYLADQKT